MVVQEKSKEERQRHWTPRALSILTLIMQQRSIRLDQLPRFIALFETTAGSTHDTHMKSTAHNLVERLQREGLLHLQRFGKGQPWIWLTKKGLHPVGSSSSWKCPARRAFPLLSAVNAVLADRPVLYCGHRAPVRALAWSRDGKWLTSASEDETLHIWEATTGKEQFRVPIPASPSVVAWSCDASWIGLGNEEGRLSFWTGSIGKGALISVEDSEKITGLAWSPQHNDLVVWCSASGTFQLHNARQNAFQWGVKCIHGAEALAWSPDGSRLAVGGNDSIVCLFNATPGKQFRTFKKYWTVVHALAWSPDSQLLASSANDHAILIRDATTGKQRRTIWSRLNAIGFLAWSPDGTRLACAGSDASVQMWNVNTGRLLQTYTDHADEITSIAWSPDSTMLASASDDGTIHVYPTVKSSL